MSDRLPEVTVPLTTQQKIEAELTSLTQRSLEGISDDPIHKSLVANSDFGLN